LSELHGGSETLGHPWFLNTEATRHQPLTHPLPKHLGTRVTSLGTLEAPGQPRRSRERWAAGSAEGQQGEHAPLTEVVEQHRWAQTQANTFEQIGMP
jgi:hypothetical protein